MQLDMTAMCRAVVAVIHAMPIHFASALNSSVWMV